MRYLAGRDTSEVEPIPEIQFQVGEAVMIDGGAVGIVIAVMCSPFFVMISRDEDFSGWDESCPGWREDMVVVVMETEDVIHCFPRTAVIELGDDD